MSVRIELPAPLREYADGADDVAVQAATVGQALAALTARYPRLRRHLFDEGGAVRGYVNLYVNEEPVAKNGGGGDTPMAEGDALVIVPSVAGGATDAPADALAPAELTRYARHLALPDVGIEGQQKLRQARVAVVGAGGLGSPLGLYLAAAGIGRIGLIDFDIVDLTNLQRQVLYGTADVGRRKTDAAAERLRDVNPHVALETHDVRLTSANALEILEPYDIVVDGTDNFPTRYLVNDACVLLGKPYVYGSIFRFDGQVSVFDARTGPCYRCIFREPPPPGLVPNCAEGGVLGVLPGVIGSLQALETLKLILGRGSPLIGRLAIFDALAFRWRELKVRSNEECPVCGTNPSITRLIDYDEFCGVQPTMNQATGPDEIPELTPAELKQRLDTGEPLTLIDVREPFEWEIANLEPLGAQLIPLGELPDQMERLNPDGDIVVYCRTGGRSLGAARHLRAHGFGRVWNLKGGITAWANTLAPDMPTY